ncbi:hypothetical protein [Desulfolutivibrio sp.]|uniref:hypothetical protein n=1 Tax=Desulfolutivibrio sp. TaxID=2773296 RepID=UPI002F96AF91
MNDGQDGDGWTVMSSFDGPGETRPEFEDMLCGEMERWEGEARRAGLDPASHVRLSRVGTTVLIAISPELEAAFTPAQTLWKAD